MSPSQPSEVPQVGQVYTVDIARVVHGGHCLGYRIDGEPGTWLVRFGLPGERVRACVTAVRKRGRIVMAEAVAVQRPSPQRVQPACPAFGPGGCGGCDFQMWDLAGQRAAKLEIVRDALRRIAGQRPEQVGMQDSVVVPAEDGGGLRWRTRSRFRAESGALAMRQRQSHETVGIEDCPIAATDLVEAARRFVSDHPEVSEVTSVAPSVGSPLAFETGSPPPDVVEVLNGHRWQVRGDGFWQVHHGAAAVLSSQVRRAVPQAPDSIWDLYAGVGLFGAQLADWFPQSVVTAVEGDRRAATLARRNAAEQPNLRAINADVQSWLQHPERADGVDVVVLDPPRSGAGEQVMRRVCALARARIVLISCDPAAMARDLSVALSAGWSSDRITVLDLFPMTGHVETVTVLAPSRR